MHAGLQQKLLRRLVKPLVFLAALMPLALLLADGLQGDLGANPVETLLHASGDWALRLLLLSLAMTPLRRWTGWGGWLQFRRMLGLYAFFYACLHLAVYLWLDKAFLWVEIWTDVIKRPYISFGFAAWLLLLPLAATSTRGMMRRLGRRWSLLHRLVYLIGGLAILHYLWLVKADHLDPLIYAGLFAALMLARLARRGRPAGATASVSDTRQALR